MPAVTGLTPDVYWRFYSSDVMTSKPYLNPAVLDAIDPAQFQAQQPFPWINPQYFIQPDRYQRIVGKHA